MIESEIASFGEAVVLRVNFRHVEIRGGSEDDRRRAERWVRQFLSSSELPEKERCQVWMVDGR